MEPRAIKSRADVPAKGASLVSRQIRRLAHSAVGYMTIKDL